MNRKYISLFLLLVLLSFNTWSQPCLSSWNYRVPITVDNSTNSQALSGYQTSFTLNTAALIVLNKMQLDGGDIRLLNAAGDVLPFWVETGTFNTSNTKIWVRVDAVAANSDAIIYLFYGNPSAPDISSGDATFELYDGFDDVGLNNTKWNFCSSGSALVSGGNLTLSSSATTDVKSVISAVNPVNSPVLIETDVVSMSNGRTYFGLINNANNGYGINHEVVGASSLVLMRKIISDGGGCFTATDVLNPVNQVSLAVGATQGVWQFGWNTASSQSLSWPGNVPALTRTETEFSLPNELYPTLGHINQGNLSGSGINTGSVVIDWVRVRKYTPIPPTLSQGTESTVINEVVASGTTSVCQNETISLFAQALPGANYSWTGPDSFSSTDQNPTISDASLAASGKYIVTATVPVGCFSIKDSVEIVVAPTSVGGTVASDATVCEGGNNGTLTLSGQTGQVIRWESSPSLNGPWVTIANTTASLNYSNILESTYYRAVVKSGACVEAASSSVLITVVKVEATSNSSVCFGGTLNLTANSVSGATYVWNGPNGYSSNDQNPSRSNVTTDMSGDYTVTATIAGTCNSVSATTAVVIPPATVSGTLTADATVCEGANTGTLTLAGNVGAVQYWESSSTLNGPWTTISNTANTLLYENLINSTYFRAVVKSGVCNALPSNSILITVNKVTAGSNTPQCEGSTLLLTASSVPGAVYTWSGTNGFTSGVQNPSVPNIAAGTVTYTVTATVAGRCVSAQASTVVTISPTTVAGTASGDISVCSGSNSGNIMLAGHTGDILRWESAQSANGPWGSISVTEPTLTYENLTTDTYFRAIVKSGVCTTEISNYVLIDVIDIELSGTVDICEGTDLELFATTLPGADYSWTGPNGFVSTDQNPVIAAATAAASGTYTVTVDKGVACQSLVKTIDILVSPPTNPGTLTGDDVVCYGINNGTITLAGHVGAIQRWESSPTLAGPWNKIQITTATLDYENLLTNTYFRAWVKSGPCEELVSNNVFIEISPTSVAGTLSPNQTVCAETNTGTIILSGNIGDVVRWESSAANTGPWSPIGNTTTSLTFTDIAATTYYRAIVQSGVCSEIASLPVEILAFPPTVSGLLTGATTVCAVSNTGSVSLAGYTGRILKWEIAPTLDGPWATVDLTSDSYTYTDLQQTQYFRAVVQSGVCDILRSNIVEVKVDLETLPGNVFGSSIVCKVGNTGLLRLNDFRGEILRWESRRNSSATWEPITNLLDSLLINNIVDSTFFRVIVKNGVCPIAEAFPAVVRVAPDPVADFSAAAVCETTETTFINSSSIVAGSIVDYAWNFDDGRGDKLSDPKHLYAKPATYDVSLTVTSNAGCINTAIKQVVVNPFPKVDFAVDNQCQRVAHVFEPIVTISPTTLASLRWELGDNNTFTQTNTSNLVHQYDTSGVYSVKLQATTSAGCIASATKSVITYPRAELNFTAESVFFGETTSFFNNSKIQQGNLSYNWAFGDGNSSQAVLPRHKYGRDGTFNVQLISSSTYGGCLDTLVRSYVVKPQVTADFSFENVCQDYPVVFQNKSIVGRGTLSYKWDFGDGNSSTLKDPKHTYEFPGKYKVILVATTELGSTDTKELIVTINPEPRANFLPVSVCDGQAVKIKNLTDFFEGPVTYNWDFGDATSSTELDPAHIFPKEGDYNVRLIATTIHGCIDTTSQVVTVYPVPVADFSIDSVCHQFESKFINKSTIASGTIETHLWDFGDGNNSVVIDPIRIFKNPGTYNVKLKITSDKGCTNDITKQATSLKLPVANFDVENVCFREPSVFVNISTLGDGQNSYQWDFEPNQISTLTDPTHTFSLPGLFNVRLTATSIYGCIDSAFYETEVYTLPSIVTNPDTTVSRGFPALLSASGGVNYFWTPALGLDNQAIPNPIAVLLEDQNYTVLGIDQNGCEGTDDVQITVINDFIIEPSNVITPDGNGINDNWFIDNIVSYNDAKVTIFSLWGEVVFEATGYQNEWGGTFNTDILPAGNYYYIISSPNHEKVYKGTITLLRAR